MNALFVVPRKAKALPRPRLRPASARSHTWLGYWHPSRPSQSDLCATAAPAIEVCQGVVGHPVQKRWECSIMLRSVGRGDGCADRRATRLAATSRLAGSTPSAGLLLIRTNCAVGAPSEPADDDHPKREGGDGARPDGEDHVHYSFFWGSSAYHASAMSGLFVQAMHVLITAIPCDISGNRSRSNSRRWLGSPSGQSGLRLPQPSAPFSQKLSTLGPRVELVAERLRGPAGASGLLVALLFEQHWDDDKRGNSKHGPYAQPDSSEVFPRKHKALSTQRWNSNADPVAVMHHCDGISQFLMSS